MWIVGALVGGFTGGGALGATGAWWLHRRTRVSGEACTRSRRWRCVLWVAALLEPPPRAGRSRPRRSSPAASALRSTARRRRLAALGAGGELREFELARVSLAASLRPRASARHAAERAARGERTRIAGQGELVRERAWPAERAVRADDRRRQRAHPAPRGTAPADRRRDRLGQDRQRAALAARAHPRRRRRRARDRPEGRPRPRARSRERGPRRRHGRSSCSIRATRTATAGTRSGATTPAPSSAGWSRRSGRARATPATTPTCCRSTSAPSPPACRRPACGPRTCRCCSTPRSCPTTTGCCSSSAIVIPRTRRSSLACASTAPIISAPEARRDLTGGILRLRVVAGESWRRTLTPDPERGAVTLPGRDARRRGRAGAHLGRRPARRGARDHDAVPRRRRGRGADACPRARSGRR